MNDTTSASPIREHTAPLHLRKLRSVTSIPVLQGHATGLAVIVRASDEVGRDLARLLGREGYRVIRAGDDDTCVRLIVLRSPTVVVCGAEPLAAAALCRQIRERSSVPVIVTTEVDDEWATVAALDAGADDVVNLPSRPEEFLARVRALRRRIQVTTDGTHLRTIRFGDVEVDLARRLVTRDGDWVRMSRTEFALLAELARNANEVLPASDLLQAVWGDRAPGKRHSLHVYIGRLRAKLEADPAHPVHIVAEHGSGYRLRVPEPSPPGVPHGRQRRGAETISATKSTRSTATKS